jgi:simple sugar transport system permease protein
MSEATLDAPRRFNSDRAVSWIREAALLPVLVILLIVGGILNSHFLTVSNLTEMGSQISALGVIVVGEAIILLIGGMDLSLESTYGLAPMLAAWLIVPVASFGNGAMLGAPAGIIILLATGAAVGLVNGFLIVKGRLNGFIVTLGMTILLAGIQNGIVKGQSPFNWPSAFGYLGATSWGAFPVSLLVAALIFLIAGLFLRYHRIGRAIYAIGGNKEAARAAGIKVDRIKIGVYVTASVLAAIGGLMEAGRTSDVSSTQGYGEGIIFTVFAAAVIGGVSLQGGRGNMVGAASGVILLGLVQNLLDLENAPNYWIDAIDGGVILVALLLARIIGGEAAADLTETSDVSIMIWAKYGDFHIHRHETSDLRRVDEHDHRVRDVRRAVPDVAHAIRFGRDEPGSRLLGGLPDHRHGRSRRARGPRVHVHHRPRQRRAARGDPCARAVPRRP